MPARALLKAMGIPWKPTPSYRFIRRGEEEFWRMWPEAFRHGVVEVLLGDPNKGLLSHCYNKLKHGPQMIVASPAASLRTRGHPDDHVDSFCSRMPGRLPRILNRGSRLQEAAGEEVPGFRVAPFLLIDSVAMEGILRGMLLPTVAALRYGLAIVLAYDYGVSLPRMSKAEYEDLGLPRKES
jgi:hypothetical protein